MGTRSTKQKIKMHVYEESNKQKIGKNDQNQQNLINARVKPNQFSKNGDQLRNLYQNEVSNDEININDVTKISKQQDMSYNSSFVCQGGQSNKSILNNISDISADEEVQFNSVYSQIMMKRWNKYIYSHTTSVDKQDIFSKPDVRYSKELNQACPEYAQIIYTRLTQELEQSKQSYSNYQLINNTYQDDIEEMRNQNMKRLNDLCYKKQYTDETIHLAFTLFDGIFYTKDFLKLITEQYLIILLVACVIIAAKVNQPSSPSYKQIIKCLSNSEQLLINHSFILQMEENILNFYDFNFNFQSPLIYIERYLRLLNFQKYFKIVKISKRLCLEARQMTWFKHSDIKALAAGCILTALNFNNSERIFLEEYIWTQKIEKITYLKKESFKEIINTFQDLLKKEFKQEKQNNSDKKF